MPSLKDFLDAMSASWPVALTILIGSSAVLAADHYQLSYVATLPPWALGTAFLLAVFSGSVVVVTIFQALVNLMARPFRKRRLNRLKARHIESLNDLPSNERYILAWAAQKGTQVFLAPYNNRLLEPLIAKGLVEIVPGHHSIIDWPFMVPDHIWKFVRSELAANPLSRQLEHPFSAWD